MTYDPQRPQRGTPQDPVQGSSEEYGTESGARATMTAEPQTQTYQTGAPQTQQNKKGRIFILAGLGALVALGGVIAGLAATNNSAPTLGSIRHVPVRHIPARVPAGTAGARHLLVSVGGTGARVSPAFVSPSGTVVAHYTYSCSAGQGSSRFGAGLVGNGANQVIANTTGTSGSRWVTLHPTSGKAYRIAAGSACPFRVSVYNHR